MSGISLFLGDSGELPAVCVWADVGNHLCGLEWRRVPRDFAGPDVSPQRVWLLILFHARWNGDASGDFDPALACLLVVPIFGISVVCSRPCVFLDYEV